MHLAAQKGREVLGDRLHTLGHGGPVPEDGGNLNNDRIANAHLDGHLVWARRMLGARLPPQKKLVRSSTLVLHSVAAGSEIQPPQPERVHDYGHRAQRHRRARHHGAQGSPDTGYSTPAPIAMPSTL